MGLDMYWGMKITSICKRVWYWLGFRPSARCGTGLNCMFITLLARWCEAVNLWMETILLVQWSWTGLPRTGPLQKMGFPETPEKRQSHDQWEADLSSHSPHCHIDLRWSSHRVSHDFHMPSLFDMVILQVILHETSTFQPFFFSFFQVSWSSALWSDGLLQPIHAARRLRFISTGLDGKNLNPYGSSHSFVGNGTGLWFGGYLLRRCLDS